METVAQTDLSKAQLKELLAAKRRKFALTWAGTLAAGFVADATVQALTRAVAAVPADYARGLAAGIVGCLAYRWLRDRR